MLPKRSRKFSASPFKGIASLAKRTVLPLSLFLLLIAIYRLFTVKKIDCIANSAPCSSEISEKLSKNLGSNLLFINQKNIRASINSLFPVEKVDIGFKVFNTLTIRIVGQVTPLSAQVSLVQSLPILSLDNAVISSESAVFTSPTAEIDLFNQSVEFSSFRLWDNGLMTPEASAESKLKYLLTEKPNEEKIKQLYLLINLVERYLEVDQIYVLDQRVFLRQADEPDIIVNIPFDEDNLVQALQSYEYLTTIKKDAKVIDLRFKNPILR